MTNGGIIQATPFQWRDPHTIPRREFLYGYHFLRRTISATIAPGGFGKSSLAIADALALATGRNLIGIQPNGRSRVWLWNGEETQDELDRRIQAAMIYFNIWPQAIGDRLFVNSGRTTPMIVAETTQNLTIIHAPIVEAVIREIRINRIDAMMVDPFISSHHVSENDNNAIDKIIKEGWSPIVEVTNIALNLAHHSRKTGGSEITVEDSRGASALIDGVRFARTLNVMTKEEGEKAGVENHRQYFRIDNGKANYVAPSDKAWWHKFESVVLPNGDLLPNGQMPVGFSPDGRMPYHGDDVGIVTAWQWPNLSIDYTDEQLVALKDAINSQDKWRKDQRANDWIGKPIAQVLHFDLTNKSHRVRINALVQSWLISGALVEFKALDEKRNERDFVKLGPNRPTPA